MKILIFGGSGVLGKHVYSVVQEHGHQIYAPIHDELPIENLVSLNQHFDSSIANRIPDVIINCAGSIPEKEPTPEKMILANSLGPWQLARIAQECGSRLIHMSTDAVFGGQRVSVSPDPIDLYGKSKLAGEPWGDNIVVVRGSFISLEYGFLPWLLEQRNSIDAWTKATWNGGSVYAMAKALVDLAEGDQEGIVHVAAEEHVTKAWMIEYLVDALNLPIKSINLKSEPVILRALEPDFILPPVKDSLDELIAKIDGVRQVS